MMHVHFEYDTVINTVKLFLEKINFSHVWTNQCISSKAKLLHEVTVRLKDSYISFWRKCLFDDSSNKLRTYLTFKRLTTEA